MLIMSSFSLSFCVNAWAYRGSDQISELTRVYHVEFTWAWKTTSIGYGESHSSAARWKQGAIGRKADRWIIARREW